MTPPAPKHQPKTNPPARKILSAASAAAVGRPTPEPALRCPRCDSPNTKFCYYNNYSLAQPRHFCKTCRRYWTRGGALRNVPIGGGCRKTKKHKPSGDSSGPPGLDFGHAADFPKIPSLALSSSPACFSAPGFQQMGSFMNSQNSLTIESLSSINQDLHWKLQRQRLATLFSGAGDDEGQKNQKNYEPAGSCGNHITNIGLSTDLFFNNPYADVAPSNLNEGTSNWSSGIQDLY